MMTRKTNSAFTLIELMIVMGIMVLVTTIAVSGYFGMSRASAYIGARSVVYGTLQTAAQRALINGKRVVVAFAGSREGAYEDNALLAIESAGIVTSVHEKDFEDRTALYTRQTSGWKADEQKSETLVVWNMRNGAFFNCGFYTDYQTPLNGAESIPGGGGNYSYPRTTIRPLKTGTARGAYDRRSWSVGDRYGFQFSDAQYLPTGFKIGFKKVDEDASPKDYFLVFEPDGTGYVAKDSIDNYDGPTAELYLYEKKKEKVKPDEKHAVKIMFDKGKLSYKD